MSKLDPGLEFPAQSLSSVVVRRLDPAPDPVDCFRKLSPLPGCIFFDSALRHPDLGRFSFLTADPIEWATGTVGDVRALARLRESLERFSQSPVPHLPPFQGGWAGCLSYDLHHALERIPNPRYDEFQLPAWSLGLFDVVVAWDHVRGDAWIISQGIPESDPAPRRRRAQQRADEFESRLSGTPPGRTRWRREPTISLNELAPQTAVSDLPNVTSGFSRDEYLAAIRKAVDYIWAGDVFQVNLAQRLLYPARCAPNELYLKLRSVNPAPFSGYFATPEYQIISASPERFFSVRDRSVETRPIKGTRRRTGFPESDLLSGYELMTNDKDRSENVMIVDLLRNDLSRCCEDESIEVTQLCGLEKFTTVLHLVSAIQGKLRSNCTVTDLLASLFPGGSVTGAPKVRAMEIIAELEPTARGPYCGSLAYFGMSGSADANILIRTVTACRGWWQLPVGGGIVAQSDPQREYDETWAKATGLLRAIHESNLDQH